MSQTQTKKSLTRLELDNNSKKKLYDNSSLKFPRCFLVMICYALLIGSSEVVGQDVCTSSNLTSAMMCTLCFTQSDEFVSCTISNRSRYSEQFCRKQCCALTYGIPIPPSCQATEQDSSSSNLTLGTILVIVFFAIPVAICIVALIHSCVTRREGQSSGRRSRRNRTEQPALSAINLHDYNMDDQFPYLIDVTESCSICLEPNCNIVTFCGHIYHSRCFAAWIHKKHKCPLCVSSNFNPISIYCADCSKAVKMTLLFKTMNEEETAAWLQGSNDKCENCKNPPEGDGLSFNMNEEDVEKYQNWKKPDLSKIHQSSKTELPILKSSERLKAEQK